jgi:hypothetical protein
MADVRRRRGEVKPDLMSAEETVHITSIYGGEERNRQEKLSVRKFMVEPAYVRVNAGMTKNMGNYESLRLDVSISMPCYPEEVDKVFVVVADKVSVFLEEELKQYE